jgi:hypothetical protein
VVDHTAPAGGYQAMRLVELAGFMAASGPSPGGDGNRWRLVAEFLEEYRHEPAPERAGLLSDEPPPTGSERWDVFLAGLAEFLATRDGRGVQEWAHRRRLRTFWFPFDGPAARADALVHSPASFRSRGVFVAPQNMEVA